MPRSRLKEHVSPGRVPKDSKPRSFLGFSRPSGMDPLPPPLPHPPIQPLTCSRPCCTELEEKQSQMVWGFFS